MRTLTRLLVILSTLGGASAGPPNILVIYADDLGYGDVSCYNPERGKIPTPHIDKLVDEGRSTPGPARQNDVSVDWRRFYQK